VRLGVFPLHLYKGELHFIFMLVLLIGIGIILHHNTPKDFMFLPMLMIPLSCTQVLGLVGLLWNLAQGLR